MTINDYHAQTYGLIAIRPGTPIQNQAIVANNLKFWVGKKTTSYCPLDDDACPPGTDTYLIGGDGSLGLNVLVPGGQRGTFCSILIQSTDSIKVLTVIRDSVYIAADGALCFTQAHSQYIPPGSITDGFYIDNGRLYWENGFSACPVEDQDLVWQIFANVDDFEGDGCTGILTQQTDTTGPHGAWQYV